MGELWAGAEVKFRGDRLGGHGKSKITEVTLGWTIVSGQGGAQERKRLELGLSQCLLKRRCSASAPSVQSVLPHLGLVLGLQNNSEFYITVPRAQI